VRNCGETLFVKRVSPRPFPKTFILSSPIIFRLRRKMIGEEESTSLCSRVEPGSQESIQNTLLMPVIPAQAGIQKDLRNPAGEKWE